MAYQTAAIPMALSNIHLLHFNFVCWSILKSSSSCVIDYPRKGYVHLLQAFSNV